MRVYGLACVIGLGVAGSAMADLEVCNAGADARTVAIGYQDDGVWVSEGWWHLGAGDCTVALNGDLGSRYYYYHVAEGAPGKGGTYAFCVDDGAFSMRGDTECVARGYQEAMFVEADTGETATSYTIELAGAALPEGGGYYPYSDFDSGMEAGLFGEPYSVEARFIECNAAEGERLCIMMAEGWEWGVYMGDATPSFAIDALEAVTPGQRIWVQGDLKARGGIVVEASVRSFQAIEERTAMDALWEALQGRYVAAGDAHTLLDILGSIWVGTQDGVIHESLVFQLSETCGGEQGGPFLIQMDRATGGRLCHVVHAAGPEGVQLSLAGQSDIQTWVRQ